MGIIAGCVFGVGCVGVLVLVKGRDGGRDPDSWAWIDVVSSENSVWSTLSGFHTITLSDLFSPIQRSQPSDHTIIHQLSWQASLRPRRPEKKSRMS